VRIHFAYLDTFSTYPPHYSVGIGYLIAALKKQGHEAAFSYIRNEKDADEFLQAVRQTRPDAAAFSSMSSMYPWVKKLAPLVKQASRETFTICGGIHPTVEPKCLEETAGLDGICRGEGEYALLDLLAARAGGFDFTGVRNFDFKTPDGIIRNPLRPVVPDLDELPAPDRETFGFEKICDPKHSIHRCGQENKRLGEFLFARGCPFDCAFCSNHALRSLYDGKYVRFRSVDKAIGELRETADRYHLDVILLHDDIITLNKKWFHDFFTRYADSIKLPFVCNSRVDTCDKEMMRLLKAAGCTLLVFGVESGNDFVRNSILTKKLAREKIIETFALAHACGIPTFSQNMVGIPGETPRRFIDTINLNAELEPNYPGIGIFHPYPGTSLGLMCREKGLIVNEDIHFAERTDTALRLPGFKAEHIRYYHANFLDLVRRRAKGNAKGWFCQEKLIPPYPMFRSLIRLLEAAGRSSPFSWPQKAFRFARRHAESTRLGHKIFGLWNQVATKARRSPQNPP